jgi:hypothetical protein
VRWRTIFALLELQIKTAPYELGFFEYFNKKEVAI